MRDRGKTQVRRCFLPLILLVTLASCRLTRPYASPEPLTPSQWKSQFQDLSETPPSPSTDADTPIKDAAPHAESDIPQQAAPSHREMCSSLEKWWNLFQDPVLDELEEQALSQSNSLWEALEKVIQARAVAGVHGSYLFPNVSLTPSVSRESSLIPNFPTDSASTTCVCPLPATPVPKTPRTLRYLQPRYALPFNFNYELDLWNRLGGQYQSALMGAQAAFQDYLGVLLSLTTEVAHTYYSVRNFDAQQMVLDKNIALRDKEVRINTARFEAGIVPYVDVTRAQLSLEASYADAAEVRKERALAENQLATLVGVPASLFKLSFAPLIVEPPNIPPDLPSDLLTRRPDLNAAERTLAAAYENIGVAYARFFPSLTLSGSVGVESPFTSSLFSWQGRFWQFGADVFQSVFDGGRNLANLDDARSKHREAMANYQQKVLEAFQDVEDALSAIHWNKERRTHLLASEKAAVETLRLSKTRYDHGMVTYLEVVDSEQSALRSEQLAVAVLGDQYESLIFLIRSLGGGWDGFDGSLCGS